MNKFTLFVFSVMSLVQVFAQSNDRFNRYALPPFRIFDNQDFEITPQTWEAIQDNRGILYAASNQGIIEYNGTSWRHLHPIYVQDFEKNVDGRIYAGGYSDIGYLEIGKSGNIEYFSLLSLLPSDVSIDVVRNVHCVDNKVYFISHDYVYVYDETTQQIEAIPSDQRMYPSITFDGKVYIHVNGKGLHTIEGDSLSMAINGDYWADKSVAEFVLFDKGFMSLSSPSGAHAYIDEKPEQNNLFDHPYYAKNTLFGAKRLKSGNYALCFLTGGFVITDDQLNAQYVFDKKVGVNIQTHNVYEDYYGDLWVSSANGFVYINMQAQSYHANSGMGVDGSCFDTEVIDNNLYLTGYAGVFEKKIDSKGDVLDPNYRTYQLIENSEIGGVKLVKLNNGLFSFHNRKKGMIEKGKFMPLLSSPNTYCATGAYDPNTRTVISTSHTGGQIELFREKDQTMKHIGTVKDNQIPNMLFYTIEFEASSHSFWATTLTHEVLQFTINAEDQFELVRHLNQSNGLRTDGQYMIVNIEDNILIASNTGLYEFNSTQNKLQNYGRLGDYFSDKGIVALLKQNEATYWFASPGEIGEIKFIGDSATVDTKMFTELDPKSTTLSFYLTEDDYLVTTYIDGAYVTDTHKKEDTQFKHTPTISQVSLLKSGATLFNGFYMSEDSLEVLDMPKEPIHIEHEFNSMSFTYGIPYFKGKGELYFRTKMQGFDKEWTEWTQTSFKEYTNLPSGNLQFQVQAKNVFGDISEVTSFPFRVSPAWYFSWPAFIAYLTTFVLFVLAALKINSKRLIKENLILENTISERTEEIRQQSERLKTLDNAKSRFFANVSHELRTPLTLIQGPLESVLSGKEGKIPPRVQDQLALSRKSAKKLLRLVEEILDLSKLEAGKLDLRQEAVNCYDLISRIFYTYQSSYSGKHLDFQMQYDMPEETILKLDIGKFEKVLDNLMSNAVKFTRDQGNVKMTVTHELGQLVISIADTGVGIAPDELAHVFNRFYQSGAGKKYKGGTGVGLALAKELVQLMGGALKVESEENEGTTFTLTIPYEEATSADISLKIAEVPEGAEIIESPIETSETNQDPLMLRNIKILVVEDDSSMRKYIASQLEAYTVDQAEDGLVAIELIEKNNYDLVITDLMMPRLDGMDLVSSLRQSDETKNTSIMMLTARAADEDIVNALTIGVNDYMVKPFNPDELQARVRNIISNRASRTEAIEPNDQVSFSDQFINELKAFVLDHLKSSSFNVASLASQAALSERQLNRRIKQATGLTAATFIREIRLNEARLLLENKTYSTISEVSYAAGFETPGYFTTVYTKRFGRKPGDYLNS